MSRFGGQVVIITGGALGIGGATARKFAKEGAKVLIADFNKEAATKNVELILSQGGIAALCDTDVSKSEDVERMVQEAIRKFGGVDVLVQNAFSVIAGENHIHGSAVSVKEESWDYGMDVMLKALYFVILAVANGSAIAFKIIAFRYIQESMAAEMRAQMLRAFLRQE